MSENCLEPIVVNALKDNVRKAIGEGLKEFGLGPAERDYLSVAISTRIPHEAFLVLFEELSKEWVLHNREIVESWTIAEE